jgi:hypothetical protein
MSELRPRRAWWVLLLLGILSLAAAAFLAFSPGFRLAPPTPFGETLEVELSAGTHAIYVTPSDRWGDIDCTGTTADGGDVQLRPDMTQQGLLVPEAWDAQGSFATDTEGNTALTCDGPVEGGRFTVGPIQSFFDIAGAVAVGVIAVVLLVLGVVRRRPRA